MQGFIKNEQGFTLIEMLVVVAIMGVLSYMSLTTLKVQKDAAYAGMSMSLVKNAITALEAGKIEIESLPGVVNYTQQNQGPLSDSTAATVLPGLMLPKHVKITLYTDPACGDATCTADVIAVKHCYSEEYFLWTRLGDGDQTEILELAGGTC